MKKILVALTFAIGLPLSIILHELFHVLMHLNDVVGVRLFSDGNIVGIITKPMPGYNHLPEELVAYLITAITLVITMVIATRIMYPKLKLANNTNHKYN